MTVSPARRNGSHDSRAAADVGDHGVGRQLQFGDQHRGDRRRIARRAAA